MFGHRMPQIFDITSGITWKTSVPGKSYGKPHEKKQLGQWVKRAVESIRPLTKAFFALLKSVNGSSAMRMLLDHKGHIDHKTIEKIVVFPCRNVGEVDDFGVQRTFMLVLSNEQRKMEPQQIVPF